MKLQNISKAIKYKVKRGENNMLTEERFSIILNEISSKRTVTLNELCKLLNTSASTVRRDINTLAEMGKLIKLRGGAMALEENFIFSEKNVEEKTALFPEEKKPIGLYAASLIDDGDFVFIDAGTTTERMIEHIPQKEAVFVTNGIIHAKKLSHRGFKVYIPGGELKLSTEAIVGEECVLTIRNYNFTKCFMGTNGISMTAGFTTPDINEAIVKKAAVDKSIKKYFLADHSKFDKINSVTFAQINRGEIITDKLPDKKYIKYTSIKEVM